MDPTDPGGEPPASERPTPPRPAWPAPPPASGPDGAPGSAPPGLPGWGPPPAPPGPPGWGPPGWGVPPPPRPARRRVGWVVAAVVGLLVAALVATVVAVRPGVQAGAGAPRAVGQRPAARLPADPSTELPRLLAKRAKAVLKGDRAAFLATVDKRQKAFYRQQATEFANMRT